MLWIVGVTGGLSLWVRAVRDSSYVEGFFSFFSRSKCHFDAFPAWGSYLVTSVFHSKMYSLLYVEVIGIT